MNTITLREVLQVMDGRDENGNPNIFDITFCTFSEKRQSGGEQITMNKAIRVMGKKADGKTFNAKPISSDAISKRNPNHMRNQTRNIMIKGTNQIRKVRIRLIEFFNGKKVIW